MTSARHVSGMTKRGHAPIVINEAASRRRVRHCAVLIVAAGFEDRSRRALDIIQTNTPENVILVNYEPGSISQNDDTFRIMYEHLRGTGSAVTVTTLNPHRIDDFIDSLKSALWRWRPEIVGEVWVDISGLPMQAICGALVSVRESLPGVVVQVIYTEAAEYFPTEEELRIATESSASPSALSKEMYGNLIPKKFAGYSDDVLTCLLVFAGYEVHRALGVVDELNPSKLVLLFGEPDQKDRQWRTGWSKDIHSELARTRPTATEVVSTLDPIASLMHLCEYYNFLFADHSISIAPICSKMQCVATYLLWERYRDVQLVFPLPVTYLPRRFSTGCGRTFLYELPAPADVSLMAPAAFQ